MTNRKVLYAMILIVAGLALASCGVSKQVVAEKDAAIGRCTGDLETCRRDLTSAQGDAAFGRFDAAACRTTLAAAREEAATSRTLLESSQAEAGRLKGALDACPMGAAPCPEEKSSAEASQQASRAILEDCRRDAEACRRDAEAVRSDAQAARKEVEGLELRERELRERLRKELEEKNVEIERLKAMLSVRVVDRILFGPGSADILPEGRAVLDKVASVVAPTDERIRVEGHTDDLPVSKKLKRRYFSNWELSAVRAAAVVRYFEYGRKIDPRRMEAVGFALYRPSAPNDSFEGRRQNRRVEIVITAK